MKVLSVVMRPLTLTHLSIPSMAVSLLTAALGLGLGLAPPALAAETGAALAPASPLAAENADSAIPAISAITVRVPGKAPQYWGADPQASVWQAPPAAQLSFQVQGLFKGMGYQAKAKLSWQPEAGQYEAQQTISLPLLGRRSQSSIGQILPTGLQPQVFLDASSREHSVSLDAQQGRIHFSRHENSEPWLPSTQDRLSVFFQLAGMLAAAPERYPQGTEITVQTVSKSSVKPWIFIVHSPQTLTLPIGTVEALQLEHLSAASSTDTPAPADTSTDTANLTSSALWLAAQWGYLPVRIRLQEGPRDKVELLLQQR